MNLALCNSCGALVPAIHAKRGNAVLLVKQCAACGPTETLISADAGRYESKRNLGPLFPEGACHLDCLHCGQHDPPNLISVDITNRCNLNCPICLNNTPSMGFLYEPPIEYFERIFRHFSKRDPKPSIQLFGGEPTVREDIFDIIGLAKSYGFSVRVVTNGLKLADEQFCRRLVETRTRILLSYDGASGETYRILRGNESALGLKQQALSNLARLSRAKVVLMTVVAKGLNDGELPELLRLCHSRGDHIHTLCLVPLAHIWDASRFAFLPERTTTEDIENMVDATFPNHRIDFAPAGFLTRIPTLMKALRLRGFASFGQHPNCESIYLLVSDGERYLPLAHYLQKPLHDVLGSLAAADRRLERVQRALRSTSAGRLLGKVVGRDRVLALFALMSVTWVAARLTRPSRLLKGEGPAQLVHAACLLIGFGLGKKTRRLLSRHTTFRGALQVVILPFEDPAALETERVRGCLTRFAFWDPQDGRVKDVPTCVWNLHRTGAMRRVADHYAQTDR